MTELMIFRIFAEEEARLAHVEIEAFQTAIAETNDWILFTNVAFRLVACILASE